ncbi:uncharacterized protein LOC109525411 isoform X4 [Hippocampus comes]|uniref:uncharacterized protein LOC109525411 isoform X4 n=1 Tax=Hippocampus comes TaxID=109280 RepID=UPI00094E46E0|nr:PREDICTED: uncharacterized protein LOC109525411 isoform X4 [Hippocampus comes]
MRMKPNERKRALLAIRENIEMELFSSEESCEARSTQELQEDACFYQNLEHPLVCICEEEPTLDVPGHQDRPQKTKPDTVTPVRENITGESRPLPPVFMEDIEIEMETFHAASSNKASRMKWKRVTPQMTGLVVKDVLCLPRGHYNTESARNGAPQGKERAALSAMGLSARITIDRQWSAKQMESRLAVLFRGRVAKRAGQSACRGFCCSRWHLRKAGLQRGSSGSQDRVLCIYSATMNTCRRQVRHLGLTGENYVWRDAKMEIIHRTDATRRTLRLTALLEARRLKRRNSRISYGPHLARIRSKTIFGQ